MKTQSESVVIREPGLDAARASSRPGTYYLLALALTAIVFAYNVRSWTAFAQEVGGPVSLFTQTDFPGVLIGARIAQTGDGSRLYDLRAQLAEEREMQAEGWIDLAPAYSRELNYPYPYTPFLAVLWAPAASALTPLQAEAMWDLANLAGMAVGVWLLLASLPLTGRQRPIFLLGALTCFPFINNLEQGQSSGITMLGLAGGIALLRRGRDWEAGAALGVLLLKVQWLPLIVLVLLVKGRWRALAGLAGVGVALLVVTVASIGWDWAPGFVRTAQRAQEFAPELALNASFSHSFSGLVAGITGSAGRGGLERALSTGAVAAAAGLLVYLWRGSWEPGTARWDGLMAATVLATVFTNLQVNTHDLCLLALPSALGYSYLTSKGWHVPASGWAGLSWALYLLLTVVPAGVLLQMPLRLTSILIAVMLGMVVWSLLRARDGWSASVTRQVAL